MARQQYGRHPDIHRAFNCWINVGPDASAAYEEAKWMAETYHQVAFDVETLKRWLICGDGEACARQISAYETSGVQTLVLVLAARNQSEQLRRIAREIFPVFRG